MAESWRATGISSHLPYSALKYSSKSEPDAPPNDPNIHPFPRSTYTAETSKRETACEEIFHTIRDAFSTRYDTAFERDLPPHRFWAVFEMKWDIVAFLRTQDYGGAAGKRLSHAVTLTGSATNALAASAGHYMEQTWPETGATLMALFEDFLSSGHQFSKNILLREAQAYVEFKGANVLVHAVGSRLALSELGQQLAWMQAALYNSPSQNCLWICTPSVDIVQNKRRARRLFVRIRRKARHLAPSTADDQGTVKPGRCWHSMFKNQVIIQGFPIPMRHSTDIGLEMPFEMMSSIGQATYIAGFDGALVLKGFCTMFVATRQHENSFTWHFLFNEDGSRLRYNDAAVRASPCKLDIDPSGSLITNPTCRHFVGWASSTTKHLGTSDVNYGGINYSIADRCSSGYVMEKMTVSGGKQVTIGATFAKGDRDKPLFITTSSYHHQIQCARDMYTILYDTGDHRAWLTDGASAILHLLQTQLASMDPQAEHCLFKPEKFRYPEVDGGPNAARDALLASENLSIPIFKELESLTGEAGEGGEEPKVKFKYWTIKDAVQEIWSVFEQIQDRYALALASPNIQLRLPMQSTLQGFDYMEIVRKSRVLKPRETNLEAEGSSWLRFTRDINAVPLFACGLGNILRPSHDSMQATVWTQVPTGQDFLAASTYLLKEMAGQRPHVDGNVVKIFDGWTLTAPRTARDCEGEGCPRCGGDQRCVTVHQLQERKFSFHQRKDRAVLESILDHEHGAVIFGKNKASRWERLMPHRPTSFSRGRASGSQSGTSSRQQQEEPDSSVEVFDNTSSRSGGGHERMELQEALS